MSYRSVVVVKFTLGALSVTLMGVIITVTAGVRLLQTIILISWIGVFILESLRCNEEIR